MRLMPASSITASIIADGDAGKCFGHRIIAELARRNPCLQRGADAVQGCRARVGVGIRPPNRKARLREKLGDPQPHRPKPDNADLFHDCLPWGFRAGIITCPGFFTSDKFQA
jgi:hypothetical protein